MSNPYRLIIWGPGEIGGSVLRAAAGRDDLEIVGVKVFSPDKQGKDAGELVGIEPIGVAATTSKEEILALDADCVILTPAAKSIWSGLDEDVIALLESGKNVVASVSYHNAARTNWTSASRPSPARLEEACRTGGVSLYGGGAHPTFMSERIALSMAGALNEVMHVRFVEAIDFGLAPEGMWGGLDFLGFGQNPDSLGDESFLARIGDLAYGDMAGNIAYALYGTGADDIRVERTLRGIPSPSEVQAGGITIAAGTVGCMHMTHRAYIGDRHFFTNEECWYAGAPNLYRGDELPFDGFKGMMCYTIELKGAPGNLRTQLEFELNEFTTSNPITNVSVRSLLDAVGPICEADPGILVDDARPRYHHDTRIAAVAAAAA